MGGIVLVFLLAMVVVILVTPALRARAKERREAVDRTDHETVVSRLEDHRRRRNDPAGPGKDS
jgi:hypothetical protein